MILFCSSSPIFNYTLCVCTIQVCEHYVARGIYTNFPDWTIAAAGSETNLRIGYEYGRFVTGVAQPLCMLTGAASSASVTQPSCVISGSSTLVLSTPFTSSIGSTPKFASGPVPPNFDRSDFQSPTIAELRAIGIGLKTCPGKLDLLVYCPLNGRCPHCSSALISANSVGKRKLCYAIPWPKSIVGIDMRCTKCKKHFMTHDPRFVSTLPSAEQVKREFVTAKGNGTHMSLICLLRSGMTVAQVERYIEEEVREHYLVLKSKYIALWGKVCIIKNLLFTSVTTFAVLGTYH